MRDAGTHISGTECGKHGLPTLLVFFQGTVTKVDQKQGRHRIQYDDGLREWLPLHRHRFRWLAPRGRSSGYKASCKVIPAALLGAGPKRGGLWFSRLAARLLLRG